MRTVSAFGGEVRETKRYSEYLEQARVTSTKLNARVGLALGILMGTFFLAEGLTFWYGGTLVKKQVVNKGTGSPYTGGDVLTVLFSVIMGAFGLGQVGPALKTIAEGRIAMYELLDTINEKALLEPPLEHVSIQVR